MKLTNKTHNLAISNLATTHVTYCKWHGTVLIHN